ncbi:MAG: magnesium transporter [Planctomycetes bacterium]|nr:magnesium transporter [Planctomycetota bacterium]
MSRATALHETLLALFELGESDSAKFAAAMERVAPEDVAAVLTDFESEKKLFLFRALPSAELQAVVLEETDQQSHREILEGLAEKERHEVLGEMPVDDLVDHLEQLPEAEQRRLIATLEKEEAEDVRELLGYDPDTAGGMMTTEFITIRAGTTSREALAAIQGNLNVEVIAYVYVTDAGERLKGIVSIREILRASPSTLVDSYMATDVVKVGVDTDREEVASCFDKYNLAVVPVVDSVGRIRGIVTFDDVIDAMQEEHSEDMFRMAGTTSIHPLYERIHSDVGKRLPFLMMTMIGGLGVATILDRAGVRSIGTTTFVMMVIWVQLVCALSGNVAVVTSTVLVRALATGEIGVTRLRRAFWRAVFVNGIIAVILALLAGIEMYLFGWVTGEAGYRSSPVLGSLMLAVVASVTWAGLIGAAIPLVCHLSGKIDPAIASGPFVTVTCDISSSLIFFLIINALLQGVWTGA